MADPCKYCLNDGNVYCFACDNGNFYKPITQADRIRAMSDEELAKVICPALVDKRNVLCIRDADDCEPCALKWLLEPVGGAE